MKSRNKAIGLSVAGLAVVGSVVGYGLWARSRHHVPAARAVPASTFLAISVDVGRLRGSRWFDTLEGHDLGKLVGLPNLKDTCGYDATAQLDEIDIAVPEGGEHGDFGIAMEAKETPLDDHALVACVQKLEAAAARSSAASPDAGNGGPLPASSGAPPAVRERNGFSLLDEDGVARFALRPGGPYLTGRGAWLDAMVDSAAGVSPSLADNPAHAALRAAVERALPASSPAAIVVTALLPPDVRSRVRAEMTSEARGSVKPEATAAMDGVLGVSGAALAMGTRAAAVAAGTPDATPGAEAPVLVDVAVELQCETDSSCGQLEGLLERKRAAFAHDFRVRLLGLGPTVESLTVVREGARVHVALHFDPTAIVRAVQRISGGAGSSPAPGPAGVPLSSGSAPP